jgi:hypothetical protein
MRHPILLSSLVVTFAVAVLFLAGQRAFGNPEPPLCYEHGPHWGSWQCSQQGQILNPGQLTWTNGYFCLGSAVASPYLLWPLIDPIPESVTYGHYDCRSDIVSNTASGYSLGLTFSNATYCSSSLPGTAIEIGVTNYDVYLKLYPTPGCAIIGPLFLGKVRVTCMDPSENVDADTLPDCWEMHFFGNLNQGPEGDYDNDGLSNYEEYILGFDPTHSEDADGDRLPDFIDAYPHAYDSSPPTFVILSPLPDTIF